MAEGTDGFSSGDIRIELLRLTDLQPSQFYISQEKLDRIMQWFNPKDLRTFEPISIKMIDGAPVMLDGHTRAVAALQAGLDRVPLEWEKEEWDWEMYRRCISACRERKIFSPRDLLNRIVSAADYRILWDDWCDEMQKEVEKERKRNENLEADIDQNSFGGEE